MARSRFCFAVLFFVFFVLFSINESIAASPDYNKKAYAHYMTGVVLDNANQVEAALREFEQAKLYDSGSDVINLRMAIDYIKLGDSKKAVRELNNTLEINPDNLQARTLLAFLYTSQGEFALAEIQYEIILNQAAKEDPENLDVRTYLSQLYFQQRKFNKATEQLKFILGKEPKNTMAKLFLGLVYDEQGLRADAIKQFQEILAIDPNDPDALNALGYIYAYAGEKLDEAEKLIVKALEKDAKNGAYVDSLGWVYYKKGQFDKARKKLEEAAFLEQDPVIFDHLADTYFKLGDKNKAKENWQKALKLKPNDPKIVKEIQDKINKIK